ncbi:MAG: flagellar filament capping protein FliD [Gammaproteobacteria bacterium]|nr:flagellar filament capping protein FliD [Gammaproteobacteria bacterium]
MVGSTGISSPGIGSGIDVNSLVTQLMKLEAKPLQALQSKKNDIQVQVSSLGKLKSSLATFQTAVQTLGETNAFNNYLTSSSDNAIVTASADATAAAETHTINVTQLATTHRLASKTYTDSATVVGTGSLTINAGATSLNLTIDNSNNTLAGIRDAINNASANNAVTASLINEDGGTRLVLTAKQSGLDNAIEAIVVDDDTNNLDLNGLSALSYTTGANSLSVVNVVKNAIVEVDGFTITRSSNAINGVISGITLNLKDAGLATITTSKNTGAISKKVDTLVKAYNDAIKVIRDLRKGALANDGMLLTLESRMKDVFLNKANISSSITYGFEVGFEFDDAGKLSINASKFDAAIGSNLASLQSFFDTSNAGSLGEKLDTFINSYVKSDGVISLRTNALNSRTKQVDSRIEQTSYRLEQTEKRMYAKFTALDSLMGQLQTTSNYLTQQLTALTAK